MPTSDAQKRATIKWRAKNYAKLQFDTQKGNIDRWKAAAAEAGLSYAGFITAAIEEKITRDGLLASPAPEKENPPED